MTEDNPYPYVLLDNNLYSSKPSSITERYSIYGYNLDKTHLRIDHNLVHQIELFISYYTYDEIDVNVPYDRSFYPDKWVKVPRFDRKAAFALNATLSKLSPTPSEKTLQIALDLNLFNLIGYVSR